MEPVEYIDKKKAELKLIYGPELDDQAWGEIQSQIKSAINLGLSEKDCNRLATLKYNYAQREVIKYACFSGLSDKFIDELLIKTDEKKLPYQAMIKQIDEWKYSTPGDNSLSDQMAQVVDTLKKIDNKTVADAVEKKDLAFLSGQIREKENEIARLQDKLQVLTDEKCVLTNENEQLHTEIQKLQSQENFLKNTNKRLFKKRVKDKKEEKIPPPENPAFVVKELPKDFNLSTYLMNSTLSSSQMEIIALAVRLGINKSLIKQMVDSGCDAEKLKQILEVLVVQMEQEKRNAGNPGEINNMPGSVDIELFD